LEIIIWDGGLQEQEIDAINIIKKAFSNVQPDNKTQARGGSLQDQLESKLGRNSMFPWKGYAGFRFLNSNGKEGEFDLVIVTHCNVIIVELKDWNHAPVTASGEIWFKGDKNMGRSPVSVTRSKQYTLKNKLKKLSQRFTNKGYTPFIEYFVVMTGNADFSQLPEVDLHHTISMKDFLKYSDKAKFNDRFRPHPNSLTLNRDFAVFDDLFKKGNTAPKTIRIGGYTAVEEILDHPKHIYKEYLASTESAKGITALMRLWNFNKGVDAKTSTPDGRAEIVSREREVLQLINYQNRDLYNHCLRSLTSIEKDEITSQHIEVYELPPGHVRFNEFIGKYCQSFVEKDRLTLVKLLIARFSDLHEIKIAHRDVSDHSLWLSPTKEVALSNFISAYHQPIGTVGDHRSYISIGAVELTEIVKELALTPFQQDVHALGLVSWFLLTAQRISPKSLGSVQNEILSSNEWYSKVIHKALNGGFKNAGELFDALKLEEPNNEAMPTFDESELDVYRHRINHIGQFPMDGDYIVSTDEKEVYISQDKVIKAWLNVGSNSQANIGHFYALTFLKKIDKLAAVNATYLPRIYEYGLATRSNSMYLVTEKIDGLTWLNALIKASEKIHYINKLVDAIEHLHSLEVSHGDLHPENVIIDTVKENVYLIDIPDYSRNSQEIKNHLYSPENIDNCSSKQRDIFAVIRMSYELLGMTWGAGSTKYPKIAEAIQMELDDFEFGFKDLGRFKKAISSKDDAGKQVYVDILLSSVDKEIIIRPDNGKLYVKIDNPKNGRTDYSINFHGIGGSFITFYDKTKRTLTGGLAPRIRSDVNYKVVEECNFEMNAAIRIKPGKQTNLTSLSELIINDQAFNRAIEMLQAHESQNVASEDGAVLNSNINTSIITEEFSKSLVDIPTRTLWKAILETETESKPNIELNGGVARPVDISNDLILPYGAEIDPLGEFERSDEVEALIIEQDGSERVLGAVSLKKSNNGEIRLEKCKPFAKGLKDGDLVYFRSKQDRASYRKRKAALERIIDREGVLPGLVELFDPACSINPTEYNISIADEDFERYDRYDHHGNKISLNAQQREAFKKLLNYGPLSLLQGPPGTGKTEFIAAFVHFLIEKLDIKRILLVSQSHEAVNTAAERIRKHCERLGTTLEVVRFSNSESSVSNGLKDVYSHAITTERRELFNAEYRYRVAALAGALGFDAEFISKYVDAELKVFKQIDLLESLKNSISKNEDVDDIAALKLIAIEQEENIREKIQLEYGINLAKDFSFYEAKSLIKTTLCTEFGIRQSEAKKVMALAKISRDVQEALSSERVNCDEFYARSRQLVTGTCVGIGQGHIGVHENIYDFVIIDEAARSISSELGIAMQSAKRILLVGDHQQLPPHFSDEHKSAIARKLGINESVADFDEVLKSDFARAFNSEYGKQISATLLTQYRMEPRIGNLVSKIFYDGKLENGDRLIPDIYLNSPYPLRCPVTWIDTAPLGEMAHHQNDRGVSIYNRCEADQVINLLKQISLSGQFLDDLSQLKGSGDALIGVVCMYAEQKRVIRQKFSQELWAEGFKDLVKIDTVDSYQGKENRIIILTLTRSDNIKSPGFLRVPNRINVAMSRAMDRLIIIGNCDMWKFNNKHRPLGQVISFMNDMSEANGYNIISAQKIH
jgi:serine/threonine protein kinase